MQLMAESSEEGSEAGFGWVPGRLKRFQPDNGGRQSIRVPHMGWNIIEKIAGHGLYDGMQDEARFYFDHSYYLAPENDSLYCGEAHHGVRFAAGLQRGKLFGVQFHPEKSHRFGLKLLENFLKLASAA
jgi:glutamine amidotransferase